jgi:hypothetical protein
VVKRLQPQPIKAQKCRERRYRPSRQ